MDEPFGALDALIRGMMQEELLKIWEETHQTIFMITHDESEEANKKQSKQATV